MVQSLRKKITDYDIYIIDMDGTLYYKKPLRLAMMRMLVGHYLIRVHRWKELMIIWDYRKLREDHELLKHEAFEQIIRQQLADVYHCTMEQVDEVIEEWMFRRPLAALWQARDVRLSAFIEQMRAAGRRVYLYSDYPVENKKDALHLDVDGCFWPKGDDIVYLKPNPQGICHILACAQANPMQAVMIGDRYEKDGICAKEAGVDYLILASGKKRRLRQYEERGLDI